MSSLTKCIYCDKEKVLTDLTEEHIFPDSLGGNLCGNFFETKQVCSRCNSISGLFIDGSFIKNWVSKNFKAQDFMKYLNWDDGCALPLTYWGFLQDISLSDNEVCELWTGPCGDTIYHFHKKDETRFQSYPGGNPIYRRSNPGYVFIFLATKQPNWSRISLLSFREHFKKAIRYSGNCRIMDSKSHKYFFTEIPSEKQKLLEKLKSRSGKEKNIQFSFQLNTEKRFMCKVGLGMGFKLLGNEFLKEKYTKELRYALWNIGKTNDKVFNVLGSGTMFDKILPTIDYIAWDGGHTIIISPVSDYLHLSLILYGKIHLSIVISNNPCLWRDKLEYMNDEGIVFVIVPQIKRCVGPIDLPDYIGHQLQENVINELVDIEKMKVDLKSLPHWK